MTLVAQAAVGYTQYFTHLPAGLVEVHVIGATVLVVGVVQFLLALTHHPPEVVPAPAGATAGAVVPAAAGAAEATTAADGAAAEVAGAAMAEAVVVPAPGPR